MLQRCSAEPNGRRLWFQQWTMQRIREAKEMPQVDESVSVSAATRVPVAARLNRLPVTSLHRRIMLVLGFVFFFDHADINTLSFAAPAIMKFWNIEVTTIALFNSA